MNIDMYNKYLKNFFDLEVNEYEGDFVRNGNLRERRTNVSVPVKDYIPRFCSEGYNESFGFQWYRFKNLQLDSRTAYKHSYDRLVNSTKWTMKELEGKAVLECGCGPGRFTEIFLEAGADVVAVDMSNAIDVNLENNGRRKNLLLIQCDINQLPFFYNRFEYVFCYGVIQHTAAPDKTFANLVKYLMKGKISIDSYRKMYIPTPWSTPKYFWRPITKRIKKDKLLKIIQWYIPKYIDFDTFIKNKIKGGWLISGLIPIPCWNYLNMGYSHEERIQHAIMDTFDALSPAYDYPKTKNQVIEWFKNQPELTDVEIFYGSNGVVGNAAKK